VSSSGHVKTLYTTAERHFEMLFSWLAMSRPVALGRGLSTLTHRRQQLGWKLLLPLIGLDRVFLTEITQITEKP
jgi:hypothetical protein